MRGIGEGGAMANEEVARLRKEVEAVRVELVQDISFEDCCAEGIEAKNSLIAYGKWQDLWNSINVKRGFGWDKNPWVWVVEFGRVEK